MLQSELDILRKNICHAFSNYWGDKIDTFVITDNTTIPHVILTIETDVYDFLRLYITLEHSSIGFYIHQNGGCYSLLKNRISIDELQKYLPIIDDELRLRIPDKFLHRYGWL